MNAAAPNAAGYADARTIVAQAIARAIAPRKPMRVSEWAERHRVLSQKGSSTPGRWRNDRNPLQVEPMDCFSARSPVHDVVCLFPIQFGKSELESNILGYSMCENPGPIMVALPGEVSLNKWVDQKLNPMLEETPAIQRVLTSVASRESSNRRFFKDFLGGQLYIEHAGNPTRLKSTSVKLLLVDEFSSFANQLRGGDDPDAMLDGRTSAFPTGYKRLKVGTPDTLGTCRLSMLWDKSDQRQWHVPCPHCGHEQPLEWSGLQWTPDATHCWYCCRECGGVIEEHQKPQMIAAGRWVPAHPERKIRGYRANCLYYPLGLGPRWLDLVHMWRDAQADPAKLKTFVNDRLAEAWEDPAMRAVKHNLVADRAEPVPLRPVPNWVLAVTAGIDTQDNRLAVHTVGWGRGMTAWTLDYVELPGDPAEEAVWLSLTDLLNRPIERADGVLLRPLATAIDAGGHRTEAVKHYVRQGLVPRPMCIFGAVPNNAPILSKPKPADVTWRGRTDKRGITIYHVGTVAAKHYLYSRLSADAERQPEARLVHLSDQLPPEFFAGLVSEVYNPVKNRFDKRIARNEPLDTWVYAYAAALHPELRLHRWTHAQWDARAAQLLAQIDRRPLDSRETRPDPPTPVPARPALLDSRGTHHRPRRRGAVIDPT